jgi:hypothetical protein
LIRPRDAIFGKDLLKGLDEREVQLVFALVGRREMLLDKPAQTLRPGDLCSVPQETTGTYERAHGPNGAQQRRAIVTLHVHVDADQVTSHGSIDYVGPELPLSLRIRRDRSDLAVRKTY